MRIVIAAHNLRSGGGISVGRNIIAAFGRLAPQHQYLVTAPTGLGYEQICHGLPKHELSLFHYGGNMVRRYIYEAYALPSLVGRFRADAALCLGNVALQRTNVPQAVLLHNPYYVYPSRHYGRATTLQLRLLVALKRWQFARDLQKVRLLMCQTDAMRARVRTAYGYQGPIRICPNAVSRFTLEGSSNSLPALPSSLQRVADKRRLFCLTAYYTHKNLEAVVDLFHQKREVLRDYAAVLTIDPSQGSGAKKLLHSIRRFGLDDTIINVGPLPQQALSAYFAHSHALFMPTLIESFSGTYLEAMHFGLPILTSNLDFAHEVCGDAAIYFDPWSLDSMAEAVIKSEKHSDEFVGQGRMRLASLFRGWDEVGADFLGAVEGISR